jgi:hypothetical protein
MHERVTLRTRELFGKREFSLIAFLILTLALSAEVHC